MKIENNGVCRGAKEGKLLPYLGEGVGTGRRNVKNPSPEALLSFKNLLPRGKRKKSTEDAEKGGARDQGQAPKRGCSLSKTSVDQKRGAGLVEKKDKLYGKKNAEGGDDWVLPKGDPQKGGGKRREKECPLLTRDGPRDALLLRGILPEEKRIAYRVGGPLALKRGSVLVSKTLLSATR